MQILEVGGVKIEGVQACLPERAADNLTDCLRLFGDAERARAVVETTGVRSRRLAEPGTTSLDLCCRAAETLFAAVAAASRQTPEAVRADIGAVVSVSLTPERLMPGNASQAQRRLGLPTDLAAFELTQACAGYPYGLYLAGTLARSLGRRVLLLDGDVQSAVTAPDDAATVPVLSDAGTATLVAPTDDKSAEPWRFAFMTAGAGGDALTLSPGGTIAMDGFAVFRFVAADVQTFLQAFLQATGRTADDFAAFVPHQANVYMVSRLAQALGFAAERLWISADTCGNPASASVPVTLAAHGPGAGRVLLAGFGGGLAAAAADIGY